MKPMVHFIHCYRIFMKLLLISVALVLIAYIILFPIRLLTAMIFGSAYYLDVGMDKFITATPFFLVAICRYFYPAVFEKIFFSGLQIENPSAAATLSKVRTRIYDIYFKGSSDGSSLNFFLLFYCCDRFMWFILIGIIFKVLWSILQADWCYPWCWHLDRFLPLFLELS